MSNELWNSEVLRIKEAESGVGASWLSIITDAGPDWAVARMIRHRFDKESVSVALKV